MEKLAKLCKEFYDALLNGGFSKQEAISLVTAYLKSSLEIATENARRDDEQHSLKFSEVLGDELIH